MAIDRRDFLKIAAASGAGTLAFGRKAPAQGGKFPKKVVILGFDGASPVFVEKWMKDGLLPNLANLRAKGSYARITTANPPQTPVSWASFATGMNPGKTKLFDFLRRDPKTYGPSLALVTEGRTSFLAGEKNPIAFGAGAFVAGGVAGLAVKALYNVIRRRMKPEKLTKMFDPKVLAAVAGVGALAGGGGYAFARKMLPKIMPTATNPVQGQTFWQFLDDRDVATASFRVPARFPADRLKNGRAVAGLGVPDVAGTIGYFTYYTTELLAPESGESEMGGTIVPLYFKPTTLKTETVVYGPRNILFPTLRPDPDKAGEFKEVAEKVTVPLKLAIDGNSLRLETPEWSGTLSPGQWSKPVTFTFNYNKLFKLKGYAKFYLLETLPEVKLYLQPISIHPKQLVVQHGPVRISTPPSLIGDLYDSYGPFKTLGWAADTWALNELRIPEEVFLEDLREYVGQYREMMMELLRSGEPLFVDVFSFTDRIGHMFWHHLDPTHPLYDADNAAKYGNVMLDAYQTMDSIVGDVMKSLTGDTWLFVLSDHGFQSYASGFNYNTWLVQNGLLVGDFGGLGKQKTLEDLFGKRDIWKYVDWSRTKAYALGLGGIYVNLKDREGKGTVAPGAEYEQVRNQIVKGLEGFADPATGKKPVFKVYRREDIYTGFDADETPDLRAANSPGYRCAWQSSLGGVTPQLVLSNTRKWSGDHCTYEPSITKGIFFCSRKIARNDPNLLDFFPTVLKIFGYENEIPGDRDGESLV